MDGWRCTTAAAAAFRLVSATNEFVATTQPWALAKDPAQADALSAVLYDAAEAVRVAGVLLQPFMPASAAEILRRMGEHRPAGQLRLADAAWRGDAARQITNDGALWPRIEDKGAIAVSDTPNPEVPAVAAAAEPTATSTPTADVTSPGAASPAPTATGAATPAAPAAGTVITIDDFMKVELRTAKILTAERMPKSKKLLKLSVDAGDPEPRTILAGHRRKLRARGASSAARS